MVSRISVYGLIAQSVEQKTENLRVGGSIPPQATTSAKNPKIVLK